MEGGVASLRARAHWAKGPPLPRCRNRRGRDWLPRRSDPDSTQGLRAAAVRTRLRRVRRRGPSEPGGRRGPRERGARMVSDAPSRPRGALHARAERPRLALLAKDGFETTVHILDRRI